MNEKVKELKSKAMESCGEGLGGSYYRLNEDVFAKLLVKECSKISAMFSIEKNSIHPDMSYDDMSGFEKMIVHTTCQQVSNKIKEYFGVE